MAVLKKNQVNQILFTMVDKVDYVTLETSLASNFTIKRVGVNHGSAACNISTLSRVPSKVGSGLYRLSLEANATNYDYVALRIAHASALTQILVYEMRTYDDTDIDSKLVIMSGIQSDIYSLLSSRVPKEVATASRLLLAESVISNAHSAAAQANSRALVAQSTLSDVYSMLTGMSNILSAVYVDTADISNILSNTHADLADLSSISSNIYSLLSSRVTKEVANASQLLLVKSLASDAHSAAAQANSRALVIESTLSDIDSALTSQYSDVRSALGAVSVTIGASEISDIASAVVAGMTTLTASDISDIASAVWAYATRKVTSLADVSLCASDLSDIRSAVLSLSAMLSDAHSAAAQANSRALVIESTLSDIDSALTSQSSNLLSYLAGISNTLSAVYVDTADISNILSNTHADLADLSSISSNIYSLLSSRVPKEVANASQLLLMKSNLSDIESAMDSQFLVYQSNISDVLSGVTEARKIARNKLHVDSATGEATLYDDDNATVLFSCTITADGDSTVRTRLA